MAQELNNWNINSKLKNDYEIFNLPVLTQQLKQELKKGLEGIPHYCIKDLEKLKKIHNTSKDEVHRNNQIYEHREYSDLWDSTNWLFYTFIENSLYIWSFNNGKLQEWAIYYWNNTNWTNDKWVICAMGSFKDWVLSEWIYIYKDAAEIVLADGHRKTYHINWDTASYSNWKLSEIQFNS